MRDDRLGTALTFEQIGGDQSQPAGDFSGPWVGGGGHITGPGEGHQS